MTPNNADGPGGRVYGPGVNVQDTSTPDRIVSQAYDFLERNLITGTHTEYGFDYSFSMPSSYKYGPSQWLWGMSCDSIRGLILSRLGGSSNLMGSEGREQSDCRFTRNVKLSTL